MSKRGLARLGASLAALVIALLVPAAEAGAIASGGAHPFAVSPVLLANHPARPYFNYAARPGATISDEVEVSNVSKVPEGLKISTSNGTTAPNSGSAFIGAFAPCTGIGCWVTGLPATVHLAPGASKVLPFVVHVPSDASTGQYLAGITVEPVNSGARVGLGSKGGSSEQAIIVNQVSVGVAVTVSSGAPLVANLTVVHVLGSVDSLTAELKVLVKNEGNRFIAGKGGATCATPAKMFSYPFAINTVLPGDEATIEIDTVGLALGARLHCTVSVTGSNGAATSHWAGSIRIPGGQVAPTAHIGPGVYAKIPPNKLPSWAIALFGLAGAIVLALLITLVVVLRRRSVAPESPTGA